MKLCNLHFDWETQWGFVTWVRSSLLEKVKPFTHMVVISFKHVELACRQRMSLQKLSTEDTVASSSTNQRLSNGNELVHNTVHEQ